MNNPILTIGIPTYNRPANIQETVRRLLPQLNPLVRLVVYDNCSDIPVSELFNDKEKTQFTIIRNRANIGGDANIAGVIYHADTKWVWDLGDDDYPLEGAIKTILDYIDEYPDALLFKFNSYLERTITNFEEMTELCKYRYVFSNFLYISSGVYNRDKLVGDLFHFYKNLSSMVGQTIFVLKHLEQHDENCYFINKKILHHSVDNFEDDFSEKMASIKVERAPWDRVTYLKRSSLIFDEFSHRRKQLNSTLFKGIALEYFRIFFETKGSFSEKINLFNFIKSKVGLWNIFRYNSQVIIQYIVYYLLPNSIYQKIKIKSKKVLLKK